MACSDSNNDDFVKQLDAKLAGSPGDLQLSEAEAAFLASMTIDQFSAHRLSWIAAPDDFPEPDAALRSLLAGMESIYSARTKYFRSQRVSQPSPQQLNKSRPQGKIGDTS